MKERIISLSEIKRYFPLEFQISKQAWEKYDLGKGIIPDVDFIKLPNFQIIRMLVNRMNEKKDFQAFSHPPIRAGNLNATGLINEIFRYVLNAYRITKNPEAFDKCLSLAKEKLDSSKVDNTLKIFVNLFPPFVIQRNKQTPENYINGQTETVKNKQLISKEIILLYLANNNPAFLPFLELFSDSMVSQQSAYSDLFNTIENFFKTQPGFGPNNKPLIDLLREPILASPYSLSGQLAYIKENWKSILPDELVYRMLMAIDVIKEEEKSGWMGKGPSLVLRFRGLDGKELPEYNPALEYERFTKDKDWMTKVVLMAKSTYVWLDQLSKKYVRNITRVDQIPDEELDLLARWGFTGLWLIGIWERSPASQNIKKMCGNPEALASAYSLYDYTLSNSLGGEEAFRNLKDRAWRRGIRLATDVVPNHTGIFSKWVIEHPDWFIQLDYPPFPSYGFTGPDLSHDPRVGLYIEDGYWTRSDAAVVFKRVDKWTGTTKYIYHGNDGTSMPWNDTAQLNFLNPEVREAVLKTILSVARNFQIIRFDAAMTLTKKHYQRLWFPHPGTGGGIPSRAEHGLLKDDFDKAIPNEFWRDVVDRINAEIPETLLLAEAFWLMEGYFVRTLGMHRVYNSAFMNMLKMEENDKYRSVIKNILEFNPEILKRFVNFMNNPDEETAIAQFGKGDKYFGISLMMVTMPGLPMFGHGQIEGFAEKYGMEYSRAYWNEEIDWDLVRRHEVEIFPLMRKRHLFSEVENFVLYDFFRPDGSVNENVYAYSNMCGNERGLIVYNNKYENTNGWIKTSCAISVPKGHSGERHVVQKNLASGLAINTDGRHYYIFKDYKAGLEYIRNGKELEEKGIYVELGAFHYHIFMDFREVEDGSHGYYKKIAEFLQGRGVTSVEETLKEMILSPIHTPFKNLINDKVLNEIIKINPEAKDDPVKIAYRKQAENLINSIKGHLQSECEAKIIVDDIISKLDGTLKLKSYKNIFDLKQQKLPHLKYVISSFKDNSSFWKIPLIWTAVHNLGKIKTKIDYELQSEAMLDELLLGKVISGVFQEYDHDEWTATQKTTLIKILTGYSNWYEAASEKTKTSILRNMLNDNDVQLYLNFNNHNGIVWFNKERMEDMLYWMMIVSVVKLIGETKKLEEIIDGIEKRYQSIMNVLQLSEKSGYQVYKFIELFV
jgi:glycosidase